MRKVNEFYSNYGRKFEDILRISKRCKNKYEYLYRNIEDYVRGAEQDETESIIYFIHDSIYLLERKSLRRAIEKWKEQQKNVRKQQEYDELEICIKIAESILNIQK